MKSFFVRFLNAVAKALTGFEPCCRFEPSCSHYFMEALEKRGWIKGSWLGMKRLLRCAPNQKFGYDPVP